MTGTFVIEGSAFHKAFPSSCAPPVQSGYYKQSMLRMSGTRTKACTQYLSFLASGLRNLATA
eukprot:1136652-Pelagomonas_calceolata.AAC.1